MIAKVQTIGIAKRYGGTTALEPTELSVQAGEFLTLLGPSGSGKTTMLQMISGLIEPTEGRMEIDGRDVTDVAPGKRDIGLVFQSYALFPHMTVWDNVAYGLRMRRMARRELRVAVDAALTMVRMNEYARRYPRELSGGQQQRVALARCFAYRPSVILLDEPLGALDKKLREHMQGEIRRLHLELGATFIYVTHDQDEALTLSDRICLMNQARVEQIGTPADLYDRPATRFVAGFIGHSNLLDGTFEAEADTGTAAPSAALRLAAGGRAPLPHDACAATTGTRGCLLVRPETIRLVDPDAGFSAGVISDIVFFGSDTRVQLTMSDGSLFNVRCARTEKPRIGERVGLLWDPQRTTLLDA
ncbi:putative spermidine/putrescine transport system ATP-binding protein [Trinickia symbiotica]|uniref:ABC transporter ATP-binding protein n=1 Tax=Trinickia symbiotica TaxID=863227 RepID=A0A2N7XAR2_9BURK|nr:ABC transporter ATP-binding protein [Trinickia symbiotica]PMS38828.1 ABC transporter ATP-binding protein [Trinickia symbiotica]PPK46874.1 putative spermidine/putrescine transport system ATP-binding protein [Trinickia symbiotica]